MAKNIDGVGREAEDSQGTGCECRGVHVKGIGVDKEGNLVVEQAPLDPKVVHGIHLELTEALQMGAAEESSAETLCQTAETGVSTADALRGGGQGKTGVFRAGYDKIKWRDPDAAKEAAKKAWEN